MLTQLEFENLLASICCPERAAVAVRLPRPDKEGMSIAAYTIGLAAALKSEALTHALFNLLTAVARSQAARGYATIPQVAIALGVSFNSVHIHLHKSPDLFEVRRGEVKDGGTLNRITLAAAAIGLLVRVNKRAKKYAKHPTS
jgi:hypothetical protein